MHKSVAEEALSRSAFLRAIVAQSMSFLGDAADTVLPDRTASAPMRPPGALPEPTFLSTCEPFCADCRAVCPRESILQDPFGFPYVDPHEAPCVMCLDVPCTQVCPTGALTPLDMPSQIAMGTAVIEATVCTAYAGSGCRVCHEHCPLSDQAIVLDAGLPGIHPAVCTGCGVCVWACPTPGAIEVYAPVSVA